MRLPFLFLANPAAAQNSFAIVKYRALPRRDGPLRSVKDDARMRIVHGGDRGFRGNVLVANLNRSADRVA